MWQIFRSGSLSTCVAITLLFNVACEKVEEAPPVDAVMDDPAVAGEFVGIHDPSGDRAYLLAEEMELSAFRDKCRELCKVRIGTWYDESGYWVCRCEGEGKRFMTKFLEPSRED